MKLPPGIKYFLGWEPYVRGAEKRIDSESFEDTSLKIGHITYSGFFSRECGIVGDGFVYLSPKLVQYSGRLQY